VRLYWEQAVGTADTGHSWAAYAWYRECVQYMLGHEWYRWVGLALAIGEVLIAIALILGLFSGLAALGAAFLNFNVLVAGGLVTNPVLFLLTVLLILVWRTAGRIGLDHWIFPRLGVRAAM
jgi:thiosulfate dehydrogenase (quinone) large subunit